MKPTFVFIFTQIFKVPQYLLLYWVVHLLHHHLQVKYTPDCYKEAEWVYHIFTDSPEPVLVASLSVSMTPVGVPPSVVATSVLADTLPNPSPTDGNVLHFLCETRFTISCGSIIGSSKSVSATMLGPPVEIDILDEGGDHAAMKPPNGIYRFRTIVMVKDFYQLADSSFDFIWILILILAIIIALIVFCILLFLFYVCR